MPQYDLLVAFRTEARRVTGLSATLVLYALYRKVVKSELSLG